MTVKKQAGCSCLMTFPKVCFLLFLMKAKSLENKLYTEKNLTLEFCGLDISDDMPDAERVSVPRAAIRGMLSL